MPQQRFVRFSHRHVCVARSVALSFVACPSARAFASSPQCGLTRRSTRTSRMRGFARAAGRRLACFVRPRKSSLHAHRLRSAPNHCAQHHQLRQRCSRHSAAAILRPHLGCRRVCVGPSVALSFGACPSASTFANFPQRGLTRRSTRTSRMRGFARATVRRLACFVSQP